MTKISLGDKTPQICGVKFVRADTITDEVTLDIEVVFVFSLSLDSGLLSILFQVRVVTDRTFVVQLKMITSVGAAAIISLRDLFLVGTLRVTLHPLWHEWPCFSSLSLSFTRFENIILVVCASKRQIRCVVSQHLISPSKQPRSIGHTFHLRRTGTPIIQLNDQELHTAHTRLHTCLHDLLIDYIVWPKAVQIPLWDQTQYNRNESRT